MEWDADELVVNSSFIQQLQARGILDEPSLESAGSLVTDKERGGPEGEAEHVVEALFAPAYQRLEMIRKEQRIEQLVLASQGIPKAHVVRKPGTRLDPPVVELQNPPMVMLNPKSGGKGEEEDDDGGGKRGEGDRNGQDVYELYEQAGAWKPRYIVPEDRVESIPAPAKTRAGVYGSDWTIPPSQWAAVMEAELEAEMAAQRGAAAEAYAREYGGDGGGGDGRRRRRRKPGTVPTSLPLRVLDDREFARRYVNRRYRGFLESRGLPIPDDLAHVDPLPPPE